MGNESTLWAVNAADRALQSAMPMVMAPVFDALPELADGQRRYVAAADGIYVQARTAVLDCSLRVSALALPYGRVRAHVTLRHGGLPDHLLHDFMDTAVAACPSEAASILAHDGTHYAAQALPVVAASAAHVSYSDAAVDCNTLVLDMHSHGHFGAAFSRTDDESDCSRPGPHLSLVFGKCESRGTLRGALRLCMAPYLLALPMSMLRAGGIDLAPRHIEGDDE